MSRAASSLTNAPVNLLALREDGKAELLSILDSLTGKICMVVDPALSGPLKLIITEGSKLLREHNVALFQELSWRELITDCKSILYLVRPNALYMKQIAKHVQYMVSHGQADKNVHVFFVPRRSVKCEKVLKEEKLRAGSTGSENVYSFCTIGEFNIDLIPFDDDLLSLEIGDSFRECHIDGESSSLFSVARSLVKLQSLFGLFPHIKAKGELSNLVLQMMLRMRKEETEKSVVAPEIDTLVLIDRRVDMVTPMVSPLTYEALIDEFMGIRHTYLQTDASMLGDDKDESKSTRSEESRSSKPKVVSLAMNSNDRLFAEIRHMNITAVGSLLQEKARELQQTYADRHNMQRISEIRNFVKKIPGMQQDVKSLHQFIAITERIQKTTSSPKFLERWQIERAILEGERPKDVLEYITTAIAKHDDMWSVLRLISMQCICDGGFKSKVFEMYRRELVQSYGFVVMPLLASLEKLGLLKLRKGSNPWPNVRKHMGLIQEDVKLDEPTDIAYTTAGYAPMSVRIVQQALTRGWRDHFGDALRLLPGNAAEVNQETGEGKSAEAGTRMRKTVVVFYIGGVTYLELAAYRHLSERLPYDFVVATTKVVNGSNFLEQLHSVMENRLSGRRGHFASFASLESTRSSVGKGSIASGGPSGAGAGAGAGSRSGRRR